MDADIVVTHGPAYGMRDNVRLYAEHLGDQGLFRSLSQIAPQYHICGHIHGGRGMESVEGTTFINAAVLNEAYRPYELEPIVIELPRKDEDLWGV